MALPRTQAHRMPGSETVDCIDEATFREWSCHSVSRVYGRIRPKDPPAARPLQEAQDHLVAADLDQQPAENEGAHQATFVTTPGA